MTNRENASAHAATAEELLATITRIKRDDPTGEIAGGHATLALFYQREADRAGEV